MEIKTKVIVLNSKDKGEADKLVTFFSSDLGVFQATVKGVKKTGAKLSACTFSFAFLDVVLVEKNGFYTITACDLIEPFFELTQDLDNFEYAGACLEIVLNLSHGNLENQKIFILLLQVLKNLCFNHGFKKIIFVKFMFEMLSLSGYALDLKKAHALINELGYCYVNLENGQFLKNYTNNMVYAKFGEAGLQFLNNVCDCNVVNFEEISERYKDDKIVNVVFSWFKVLMENIMGKKFSSFFIIDL